MEYYTYAYLRKDNTPFYIGKGKGNRAYRPHIRQGSVWLDPSKYNILFLKTELTETQAEQHERYMIAVLGRKDLGTGILHNLTSGGEGTTAYKRKHTPETKRKISEGSKGRTLTATQKLKRSKDQTGKHWWSNGKRNKFCVECPGPEWYRGRVGLHKTKKTSYTIENTSYNETI